MANLRNNMKSVMAAIANNTNILQDKFWIIVPNEGYCLSFEKLFAEGAGEAGRKAPYILVPTALPGHSDEMLPITWLLISALLYNFGVCVELWKR